MSLPAPARDSTVLVTGASAGIGAELARQLAARGHGLTLVARRRPRLEQLAKEIRSAHGVEVDVRKADLADQAARTRLIRSLDEGPRWVAGVCNNAGFGTFGRLHQLDRARESEEVRVNVLALHELTCAFLPGMVERGTGAVLNVASIAAFQPMPMNATYSATKAFVLSFSEALHAELTGTGVSCTALCPGPVSSEFVGVAGVEADASDLPGFVWASADDVARAGVEGMLRGRRTVIPGVGPRLLAAGGRFAPRSVLLPVAEKLVGSRFAASEGD